MSIGWRRALEPRCIVAGLILVLSSVQGACTLPDAVDAIPKDAALTELGRHLFYERRLSLNNDRSCGICHEQIKGFTDGFVRAVGTTGDVHPRNTLTLLNVSSRETLSWLDPEPLSLEQHMLTPLLGDDPIEMGLSGLLDDRFAELNTDATYRALMAQLDPQQKALDLELATQAIGAFVARLTDYDAPYDRHLAGDKTGLTEAERRGEALFFSEEIGCASCHGGADFDQPIDSRHGWFNIGLYDLGDGAYPEGRQGLFELSGLPEDIGRYRIPTLRHLRFTGPYYHDGTGAQLSDVLRNYNSGGRHVMSGPYVGDGRDNPYKDPRIRALGLTVTELDDLEAFLLALSNDATVTRPDWGDPWPRD